jgi:hypothetical protein
MSRLQRTRAANAWTSDLRGNMLQVVPNIGESQTGTQNIGGEDSAHAETFVQSFALELMKR